MSYNGAFNIEKKLEMHAGDGYTLPFKVYNTDGNDNVDLTRAYKLQFKLCRYGEFNVPLVSFTSTDIYLGVPRIEIDKKDSSIMYVHFYTLDTAILEENYYIFQIILLSSTGSSDSVMAQGNMYIKSKIQ